VAVVAVVKEAGRRKEGTRVRWGAERGKRRHGEGERGEKWPQRSEGIYMGRWSNWFRALSVSHTPQMIALDELIPEAGGRSQAIETSTPLYTRQNMKPTTQPTNRERGAGEQRAGGKTVLSRYNHRLSRDTLRQCEGKTERSHINRTQSHKNVQYIYIFF